MVRLTDHPDMTIDVYRGRKTTIQQHQIFSLIESSDFYFKCIVYLFGEIDNRKNSKCWV